jgi:hypothetical protein
MVYLPLTMTTLTFFYKQCVTVAICGLSPLYNNNTDFSTKFVQQETEVTYLPLPM